MFEIVIKGKFITGTTADAEETAKKQCEDLLLDKLQRAGISGKDGLFEFRVESVEAERLMGKGYPIPFIP